MELSQTEITFFICIIYQLNGENVEKKTLWMKYDNTNITFLKFKEKICRNSKMRKGFFSIRPNHISGLKLKIEK